MSASRERASTFVPTSHVAGFEWPAMPHAAGAAMLAMQFQLRQTQWLNAAHLTELQFEQLRLLAAHAVSTVPHYAALPGALAADIANLTPAAYLRWPVIRAHELGTIAQRLHAASYPKEHGAAFETFTSGATGTPKRIRQTIASQFFAQALVLRDHLWHERDFSAKFGAIRFFASPGSYSTWSRVTSAVFLTGPAVELDVTTDAKRQFEWLLSEQPQYLLTSPSNLRSLLRESERAGVKPKALRQVITYAEFLPGSLREQVARAWDVPLVDSYSCTEAGALALQCPETSHYHVQSENAYVEILRGDGSPCAAGETGRVVITPLHNFAMPLLRYETGDYAALGSHCRCGRGLPVLSAIAGRVRNMAVDPLGRRFQPGFDQALEDCALPVEQFQFVQQTPALIEMKYVMERDLSKDEMARFQEAVRQRLPYPFEVLFQRVPQIHRLPGGKFEGFVSMVEPG